MHEALIIAVRFLEAAFLAGMVGSAVVVIWVAVVDLKEIGTQSLKLPR